MCEASDPSSPRLQGLSDMEFTVLLEMHCTVSENLLPSQLALWDIEKKILDRIRKHFTCFRDRRKLDVWITGLIKSSKLEVPPSAPSAEVVEKLNRDIKRVEGLTQQMGNKLLIRARSDLVSNSTLQKPAR